MAHTRRLAINRSTDNPVHWRIYDNEPFGHYSFGNDDIVSAQFKDICSVNPMKVSMVSIVWDRNTILCCFCYNFVIHRNKMNNTMVKIHYNDVIMSVMASQSINVSIVCSAIAANQRKPVTGEFPAQTASNAEYVFISWRHHDKASLIIECSMYWYV